jgi:hypothetical protein
MSLYGVRLRFAGEWHKKLVLADFVERENRAAKLDIRRDERRRAPPREAVSRVDQTRTPSFAKSRVVRLAANAA